MTTVKRRSVKTPANAKSRSVVPIPDTIESIKGYPAKLVIFKIPASPFWWVRYHDGRPIKRSTKTEDRKEAIRFAKEFYETLLVNKKLGVSNNPKAKSFIQCAQAVINEDQQKASREELSQSYADTQKALINKHVTDFFRSYEIRDIDYAVLEKFKSYLYEQELAASSIKIHFVSLTKIFKHAVRHKLIKSIPLFPQVKNEDNPRGYFKLQEYKHLRRTVQRLQGKVAKIIQRKTVDGETKEKNLRNIVVTEEIQLLIPFMVYTFLRPVDVKTIKHKHIEIRDGADGDYLWMPLPKTKRHDSPITSMPKAAYYYKKLRALALAAKTKEVLEAGGNIKDVSIDEDYVFQAKHLNRDYAYQQIYRQFELILAEGGLKTSDQGDNRTLYSLRHTSLMYRLIYGGEINTTKIAKNARTSTEMMERFYVAQLESTDVTRDLHKRKKPREKRQTNLITTAAMDQDRSHMIEDARAKLPPEIGNIKLTFNLGNAAGNDVTDKPK